MPKIAILATRHKQRLWRLERHITQLEEWLSALKDEWLSP